MASRRSLPSTASVTRCPVCAASTPTPLTGCARTSRPPSRPAGRTRCANGLPYEHSPIPLLDELLAPFRVPAPEQMTPRDTQPDRPTPGGREKMISQIPPNQAENPSPGSRLGLKERASDLVRDQIPEVELRVPNLKTSRTGVSRHPGQLPGVTGVAAGLAGRWLSRSRDVESPAGHHGRHGREAPGQRGSPHLRGGPVVDLCAAGPLPRAEGEAAFEPRSRRPKTSPRAIPDAAVSLITEMRKDLAGQGLDAGPHTIAWHLAHHHGIRVSRGDRQPLPGPGRAGHPGSAEAAEVVLPAVRRRAAQRVLAVRLHPLPARRRRGHRDPGLAR